MSAVSFADLGVPGDLVAGLDARGIAQPFPIQVATLPDALAGRDLCGRAPTGSGKTIAFGIPLVLGVSSAGPRRPTGLVLVPTRELASQVHDEVVALAGGARSVLAVYGGVGFDRQIKALRRGVDIVVATPGRLADLISQRHLALDAVELVVLDEADRMADMGFLPEVRRLLDQCPTRRQTLLFSATLDGDVDVLVRGYQHDPVRHELADVDDGGRTDHHFWKVERADRVRTAAQVIDRVGSTVVFCRTKRGADRVARQLEAAGVTSAAIHGDRSQGQRERALQAFHDGRVRALVATDVAARGIHVDHVAAVVHFDPPADHKDYVHRSGRTARAGRDGVVVSLVPSELRKPVAALQRALELPVGLHPVAVQELAAGAPKPRTSAKGAARPTASGGAARHGGPKGGTTSRAGGPKRSARPGPRTGKPTRSGTRSDDRPTGQGSKRRGPSSASSSGPRSSDTSRDGRTRPSSGGSGHGATKARSSSGGGPGSGSGSGKRPPRGAPGATRMSGAARRKAKRQAAGSSR